ncbi:uncharacterized protein LOC132754334, partial [Ruditapes philippinarum]|uniref:uncharacterized protein LOC132754334 n=1 Tax=Ruditapes philippinarum TaxID=129788 RepID=UPI00295BD734
MCQPDLRHHLTVHAANIIGVICYIHGLVWAIAPFLMMYGYVYEPSRLACTPDWSHDNIGYILGLVLIQGHAIRTRFNSSFDSNVAFNTAITLGTFFITWTPYMCIALHKTLGMEGQINLSKEITLIPLVAAKTAGLWHPLVFGLNNNDIRTVIRSE